MAAKNSKQPKDGDLTMRQLVAERMKAKFATPVSWKFGHASFETADSKVFCFINREGHLAMKLPEARIASLLEQGDAKPLSMGKRTMREWVVISDPESSASLKLLKEAKAFVESLPVEPIRKPASKKSATKKAAAKKQ